MANETQYYKFPFAENGNREDVPDESISGNVSFETGYGPDYELAQGDPNRKRIPRTAYNEVLNGVTKNIKQWQENTFPTWVEDNGDGVAFTYSKGPILNHNGDIWVSLEDGNDDEPTSASDKWLLFDPSLFDIDPIFENYLKPNQNLNVPYGDAALPSAIAEDYTAGDVFAYDYEAVTDIVGMTRTGGITSGTSGTYMRSYKGDFSSAFFGVQLADGTVSQVGVDIDYNVRKAGYTTVAVDIATAPDHYCVVLSPADGRVAVVNDNDSAVSIGGVGVGQSWVDVSASRDSGITYTNTTGRPIEIILFLTGSGGWDFEFSIDGFVIPMAVMTQVSNYSVTATVPVGSTYSYRDISNLNVNSFLELR